MAVSRAIAAIGSSVLRSIAATGDLSLLFFRSLLRAATFRFKPARVVEGIFVFGWRSIPLIAVASLFVGMGIALQVEIELRRFGASQNIANVVGISTIRELGPIFTALLLAGRAGSGITAELGAMVIGDQVQAMRMLGLDVLSHFVVPMILAVTAATFMLTCVFDLVGVGGGYLIAVFELGIPFHHYHELTKAVIHVSDVVTGLAKPLVFGAIVGSFGCYYGLRVEGGGKGLGEATKRAVVAASFAILISNFFLTRALVFWLE